MASREMTHGFWMRCTGATPRDRRNLRRVVWTYLGWAVLFTGGSQLIKRGLIAMPAAWVVAALTLLMAALVAVTYARFLREADELQRVIHLEGMALGFGGGFLGVSCYRLLERLGAPPADIADAALLLAVFFAVGIVRATWRYR